MIFFPLPSRGSVSINPLYLDFEIIPFFFGRSVFSNFLFIYVYKITLVISLLTIITPSKQVHVKPSDASFIHIPV